VHALRVLLVFALCAAPALAGEAWREIGDGAARVAPPPTDWTARETRPAAGQSVLTMEAPEGAALVEAWVFPAEAGEANAPAVLSRAVTRWFAALNGPTGPAAGMPMRGTVDLLGCPGAEAVLSSRWRDAPARGSARILRVSEHQWAFAVGIAAASDRAGVEEVARVVGSLEPALPRFVDPTFQIADLDAPLARGEGEIPVRRADVLAVERAIEAAIGARLPLQERAALRQALSADLARGSATTRAGYRDVGAALRELQGRDPAEREATLAALGGRILTAVIERAKNERYEPAVAFAMWLDRAERIAVGEPGAGLAVHALESLMEHAAFLATIAGDRRIEPDAAVATGLLEALRARWPDLGEEERRALRGAGRSWARLRRAFDLAGPAERLAFRREVAARLVPGADVPEAADARALKAWMDALETAARGRLVDRAAALPAAARDALTAVLGVEDDDTALGW